MTYIPDKMIGNPDNYPERLSHEEVEKRFRKLLGEFETPSVPLNIRTTKEVELEGGIIRQRIEYDVEPGESVPAYLLFRKNLPEDAPGMLSIHAHGGDNIFPHGKAYHCHPDKDDPTQYSYIAALRGFRVLAPDALCFGERQSKFGFDQNYYDEVNSHAELCGKGKHLAWKSVWDNSRAIETLEALGCKNTGAMGWSGGSTQAYILASVNRKVKASACFFSYLTLRHQFYQFRCKHCLYHFIPGMMQAGIDWDQVAALIPPRKIFLAWGALDFSGTPKPMYRAFVEAIRNRALELGIADSPATFEDHEIGHRLTMPILNAAMEFLHQELSQGQG